MRKKLQCTSTPNFIIGVILITLTSTAALTAQSNDDSRLKAWEKQKIMQKTSLFKNLDWQFVGPTNISGRVTDVAVAYPRGGTYTIYVATASGGVWKTVNEGTTFEPIFEDAPTTSIGDVSIAPSNQSIVWVGTGESNIFRSSMAGTGVYKSIDAGKTWKQMGLAQTHTIPRIVIHPQNPDIVYVAASGHEWKNNEERGIYKTRNGGKTWEKIKYIDSKTGAIDLVMDPADPDILYAAFWQRIRKKWNDPRTDKNHKSSGIYKTTDGGKTWKAINDGLPLPNHRGRIGLDLCAAHPEVVYAFVDNYEVAHKAEKGVKNAYGLARSDVIKGATLYRSDNGGSTWKRVSEENRYMENLGGTYGWVFGQVRADPLNPDKVYLMGLGLNVSTDGGKTFKGLRGMHPDHHALWIDPENTNYLVNGQDGGLGISYDGGANWKIFTDNLPAVQFYNVAFDMNEPFRIYGSIQDHFSFAGEVNLAYGRNNIRPVEFHSVPGGEGCRHAIDPTNPDIVYSEGFYGTITRTNLKTSKRQNILPQLPKGSPALRGQWVAPFIISPHNPRIIYHGMQYLFRSLDRGDSWERISDDLSYNNPDMLGDIRYQTIFALSESPLKFGLLYTGTDDGRVHMMPGYDKKWVELTKKFKKRRWISCIEASKYAEGTVYLTQNGKRDEDFTAYVWKSENYGKTWKSIAAGIPSGPVNVIREDPINKNILYVGTDMGAYVSLDRGQSWNLLNGNFPSTFVHDLKIHPRDNIMIAATHGRGMWALDVSIIQQLTPEILQRNLTILKIFPAQKRRNRWSRPVPGKVYFYLRQAGMVQITIRNETDKAVKAFEIKADAGYNNAPLNLLDKNTKESLVSGKYKVTLKTGAVVAEDIMVIKE